MADEELAGNDDKQAALDFASGFTESPPSPAPPAQAKDVPEAPKPDPKPIAEKPEPQAPAEAPKPEYVQLTKDEHATLMAAATKTASFEGQFSKLFGSLGNVQQIVEKLRTQTPAGEKVELPKVALAKLRESFPEVADLLEEDMSEALHGIRGTGPADAPGATLSADDIQKMSRSTVVALQAEALAEDHPNWRDIVGVVDAQGKHDPNNAFRKWLVTQPVDYQQKINATDSAVVISKAIDKFQSSMAPNNPAVPPVKDPKTVARQGRIQDALQPKGDGGQPPPSKTAADEFEDGFKTG